MAAIFPLKLCAAILKGFRKQLVEEGIMSMDSIGLHYIGPDELQERIDDVMMI